MSRPIKKDTSYLHSSEAIAKRLERVLEEDEIEAEAMQQAMAPVLEKEYWVKGTSEKHTEEIKRIDRSFENQSLKSWDQKGTEVLAESEEQKKADRERQEQLKNKKWEFDNPQPWNQKQETLDEELNKWQKQTEKLMRDFEK